MAQIYPQSNTPLPRILGLLFQNQLFRLVSLITIIFISQYNFYLSSIIAIILVSSFMLSDKFNNIQLEGFANKTKTNNLNDKNNKNNKNNNDKNNNDKNNNNDNKNNEIDDEANKPIDIKGIDNDEEIKNFEDDEDYIDLDDEINEDKIKAKFEKLSKNRNSNKEAKTISECINLISTLPSDGDNTYKQFLQNVAAQRKAYLDMIKNKTDDDDIEEAKKQYRKMLKYLTEEFLNKLDGDDEDDDEDDDGEED
jgi:hypothetical protein